jgi:hypothetical protein
VKYDHLMSRENKKSRCPSPKHDRHYWLPTGVVRATSGDNVAVDFYCKYCEARVTEFMPLKDFYIHKDTIERSS